MTDNIVNLQERARAAKLEAIQRFREAADRIAVRSISTALHEALSVDGCEGLTIGETIPLFVEAFAGRLRAYKL
jgi:hypothetical protein